MGIVAKRREERLREYLRRVRYQGFPWAAEETGGDEEGERRGAGTGKKFHLKNKMASHFGHSGHTFSVCFLGLVHPTSE